MNEFGRLLESEIPRLRRYARALTRNTAKADDLVQSSLVRALEKQHLWQPGSNLRAWLFTILHNQHVNDVRHSLREGSLGPVEDAEPVWRVEPVVDASLQLRDLQRTVRDPAGPQRVISPSQVTATPGNSAAGSAWARLPPTVPRLRIW